MLVECLQLCKRQITVFPKGSSFSQVFVQSHGHSNKKATVVRLHTVCERLISLRGYSVVFVAKCVIFTVKWILSSETKKLCLHDFFISDDQHFLTYISDWILSTAK